MSTPLAVPFLTDLDSRAAVKGSRDPLGIQPIWTRFGRNVVGNLTTVTDSVRSFKTLLLGYWFAERIADEHEAGTELATFLKWEQLAAYARARVNDESDFRGSIRVRRNLAEGKPIFLSSDPAHQILGNQKVYGLWGLYTGAARASALLLEGDPPRLMPEAQAFVEDNYLPVLTERNGRNAHRIREALSRHATRLSLDGGDATMIRAAAKLLGAQISAAERGFYTRHLLHGGPKDDTAGRQRQLVQLLRATFGDPGFNWLPASTEALAKDAAQRGPDWTRLAEKLRRIRTCESVLAPVSAVFTYLLGLHGEPLECIAHRLRDRWGGGLQTVDPAAFRALEGEIAEAGGQAAGWRWVSIAQALAAGAYGDMVELLLAQNADVMVQRGGAPWIESRDRRLHVLFRDEKGTLPSAAELPRLWRFSYFLDPLRQVAIQLEPAPHG